MTKKAVEPAEIEPENTEATPTEPTPTAELLGTTAEFVAPSSTPPALSEAKIPEETLKQLKAEEEEFKKLRRDIPGVKGSSAAGIVAISVGKAPRKNEFFRTNKTFRPTVSLVDHEVGMDKQYFAVAPDMIVPLAAIGITVSDYVLYLTVTAGGAYRVVPVRQANEDGDQNEWHRTKETGLLDAVDWWQRLYSDGENKCYKVFPAPEGRYGEPQWPALSEAKIFRLAFRDKGRLIDSPEHPLFKQWAGRDQDKNKK
jgi:hypothetical protein